MCAPASSAKEQSDDQKLETNDVSPLVGWRQWLAWPLLAAIGFYRRFISPLTPPSCRFYPTCSAYGAEAILRHGPFRGTAMAVWRILKCQPFHPGGFDPVPGSGQSDPHPRDTTDASAQAK